MTATARSRLGKSGEELARRYLERKGFDFVAANWRCRAGELDLVMRDGDTLVFVEVKTRHGEAAGRVDLVAVTLDGRGAVERVTHWPDAVVTG
jgi:uncharacterized protein (TIGR00252 family)